MDGYSKSRPLYFFVLRTGSKPAFDIRDPDNDKLLRQLIADNSSRIFRTDINKCDKKKHEAVAALSGSSLPFGCWNNPKVAANVSRDLHIVAINSEVPWATYKWLDIHGHGMHMEGGGFDQATGFCYEPISYQDRVFEARAPEPGKEIAVVSEKWGEYGTDIKYISLGGAKQKSDDLSRERIASPEEPSHETTIANPTHGKAVNGNLPSSTANTVKEIPIIAVEAPAAQQAPSESKNIHGAVRFHAHRPQIELEPEEEIDDRDFDPNYGKPEPYSFGKKLSLKMPWKKREKARESSSGPSSCGSSISSAENEPTWTKTGSLPTVFRKGGKAPQNTIEQHPVNKPEKAPLCQEEKITNPKLGRMRRFRASLSDLFRPKKKRQSSNS